MQKFIQRLFFLFSIRFSNKFLIRLCVFCYKIICNFKSGHFENQNFYNHVIKKYNTHIISTQFTIQTIPLETLKKIIFKIITVVGTTEQNLARGSHRLNHWCATFLDSRPPNLFISMRRPFNQHNKVYIQYLCSYKWNR